MSALAAMGELAAAGVLLVVDGSRLRFRIPEGRMTEGLKALMSEHKPKLIAILAVSEDELTPGEHLAAVGGWVSIHTRHGEREADSLFRLVLAYNAARADSPAQQKARDTYFEAWRTLNARRAA